MNVRAKMKGIWDSTKESFETFNSIFLMKDSWENKKTLDTRDIYLPQAYSFGKIKKKETGIQPSIVSLFSYNSLDLRMLTSNSFCGRFMFGQESLRKVSS